MARRQEVDYTAVLVFPGFGQERENAETIVETALHWLNTNKDEPGFRFAPHVSAHLEIVQDADEARARIATDPGVAIVLMHDLPDDERDALVRHCEAREISRCYTEDAKRPARRRKGPWRIVLGRRSADEIPAHRLTGDTLTDPVGEDEQTGDRVGQLIAVLALGVMDHHFRKNPPRIGPFEESPGG
jgi:hypothetical protein